MDIMCLDLEGVLIPEIWIAFAEETGIEALRATTRDIADYDELMTMRLDTLRTHRLGISEIQSVISGLSPLPGAAEFLDDLRTAYQVVILSDTFYDFASPLMAQLSWPTLMCHRLEINTEGMITGYRLRQEDPKRRAVEAFRSLNFSIFAAGDSYNDTSMLMAADAGFLFRAPSNVRAEFPSFKATDEYVELRQLIDEAASR